jgi:nitroreductase
MDQSSFYEFIFKRKSVRDYDPTPLDQNSLDEITQNLQTLTHLIPEIKTEFKIISPNQVTRKFSNKAPHFIAAFSEAKDAYKINVGYMLQQMDLYFSASGLGSCWLGIPQPTKDVLEASNHDFVILMSFGNANEELYRTNTIEFKRQTLTSITNIKGADELLESVRLAPSAVNLQNWYFTGDKNLVHAYSAKANFLRNALGGSYYPVNMGIALYHLQIAAEHLGGKTKFTFDASRDKNPPKNFDYVATLEIKT